jgi:hypothetical protein
MGIFALSAILVMGFCYQQYSFGQTDEISSWSERTFRSGFDTECMRKKNLTYLSGIIENA